MSRWDALVSMAGDGLLYEVRRAGGMLPDMGSWLCLPGTSVCHGTSDVPPIIIPTTRCCPLFKVGIF